MKFDIKGELIFFLGVFFFALTFFLYSFLLRRLLILIRRSKIISFFPLLGGILLLFASMMHGIKIIYLYPNLAVAGLNLYSLLLLSFKINFLENLFFLTAGIFAFFSASIYALWASR